MQDLIFYINQIQPNKVVTVVKWISEQVEDTKDIEKALGKRLQKRKIETT